MAGWVVQDNAYLHPESWKVLQVTAWIPMLDATPHNGCMQVQRAAILFVDRRPFIQ